MTIPDDPSQGQHAEASGDARVHQVGRDNIVHNNYGWSWRPGRRGRIALAGVSVAVVLGSIGAVIGLRGPSDQEAANKANSSYSAVAGAAGLKSGPLTIGVQQGDPFSKDCTTGLNWVYPEVASKLPPMTAAPSTSDQGIIAQQLAYAKTAHGVPSIGTQLTLTIQARPGTTAVLTGMQIIVTQRRPPVKGTYLGAGGCGGLSPRWFILNLDTRSVLPQPGVITNKSHPTPDPSASEAQAVSFPYTVSEDDPEVFALLPQSMAYDTDWRIAIGWSSDGQVGQTIIDDQGKPFRFTAESAAQAAVPGKDGKWTPLARP